MIIENGWISYDVGCTFDAIGNPTSYKSYTMMWEHGRQLAGMSKSGSALSFGYDTDGVRISKTANGVETKYYTAGDQILRMEKGDDALDFLYDEAGAVFGVLHNDTPYYYVRNGQNDIVALVDQNANIIGQYSYDAWGKPLQTTGDAKIVSLNPFRYRGYVYDEETGLYYLLSRYYDPATGRYINADGLVSTGQGIGGTNMYSYCGNNPVAREYPYGQAWSNIQEAFNASRQAFQFLWQLPSYDGALPVLDAVAVVGTVILGLYCVGSGILGSTKSKIQTRAKPTSKAKTKENTQAIPKNKNAPQYWSAKIIAKQVVPLKALTYTEARKVIDSGGDIVCINRSAAIAVVKYYPTAIWDKAHGSWEDGYLDHYHLSTAHTNHIWYYME